jgi:CelD/BcsL family acetyltransferase involved in cellulose biosynthesis
MQAGCTKACLFRHPLGKSVVSTAVLAREGESRRLGQLTGAVAFCEVVDRAGFEAMEHEWNALLESGSREPFCRHEFIRSFLRNFLPEARLKVVTGRDRFGALVVALPLIAGRGAICGFGARELGSPTNVHSLRFDLVADDVQGRGDALFQHLAADQEWDILKITDVPEGGKAWNIYRAAERAGFPVGAWEAQRSPYMTLPSSYAEVLQGLSAKFRANLRRRRKRLDERGGEISVERVAGAALSESHLEECLALERSGWKGRQGTAVGQSQAARGFHLTLIRQEAFRDHLSLFLLKCGGKLIAFQYGLTCAGVYSLVMTSYDEVFKEFSPGHLLTEEVLKDCIARELREFDFLGCDLAWKLEWTATVRPHYWLFVFRDSPFGRALRTIKFGWVRLARQSVARWASRLSLGWVLPRWFA